MLFFRNNNSMLSRINPLNKMVRANKQISSTKQTTSLLQSISGKNMNNMINDAARFNQKRSSRQTQLNFADNLIKRNTSNSTLKSKPQFNIQQTANYNFSNRMLDKSNLPTPMRKINQDITNISKFDRDNLPIPPRKSDNQNMENADVNNVETTTQKKPLNKYALPIPEYKSPNIPAIKQQEEKQAQQYNNLSPQELQNLVDVANNGNGKEKEDAITILKSIMETNNATPKLTSPMEKYSDKTEISKSIESDKQQSADSKPLHVETKERVIKRIVSEIYDEKGFEYQKFIDTIYNIAVAHKKSPVLIPVLNKALSRLNRVSIIKLPEELMQKFINITLEEIFPETFKKS